MCGRTGLSLSKEEVQCACSYKARNAHSHIKPPWLPEHNAGKNYTPSNNIAPTEVTPVLISSARFPSVESDRVLKPMMWGIIPPWHKGDFKTHHLSTNNCRIKNIHNSKLYSPILTNGGRCIIVVEGFYEWQTTNKLSKVKQPYYIYAPQDDSVKHGVTVTARWLRASSTAGVRYVNLSVAAKIFLEFLRLFYLLGEKASVFTLMIPIHGTTALMRKVVGEEYAFFISLVYNYNVWQNEETIIYSYSVITMNSNNTLDWLHHRMPAILDSEEQIEAWLDVDNVKSDMALGYLKPIKLLSWHQVSSVVNNSRNKTSNCNKRLPEIEINKNTQKTLNSWFVKVEKRKSAEEINSDSKKMKK